MMEHNTKPNPFQLLGRIPFINCTLPLASGILVYGITPSSLHQMGNQQYGGNGLHRVGHGHPSMGPINSRFVEVDPRKTSMIDEYV